MRRLEVSFSTLRTYLVSHVIVVQHIGKNFGGSTMKWDGGTKYNIVGKLPYTPSYDQALTSRRHYR